MSNVLLKPRNKGAERVAERCEFCTLALTNANEFWIADLEFGSLHLNYNQSYLGRCLYIPREHFHSLYDIDDDLYSQYNKEVLLISRVLFKALKPELVNVAMLGNKVQHVHWHLIPRYKTDENWGNAPWPTIQKKLIPLELNELKRNILQHLTTL